MKTSSILALALLLQLLASLAFGAPADNPRPVVPASEILAKIERGEPVEYDGVIVVGDLDLSGLELVTAEHIRRVGFHNLSDLIGDVKFVESSIGITDSEIQGNVNLGLAIFR